MMVGVDKRLHFAARRYHAYLWNRRDTLAPKLNPFQKVLGRKPLKTIRKRFGCLGFLRRQPKGQLKKGETKGEAVVFLGK
jgi:hypothetical protein